MRLSILTLSPKAAELAAQVAALFEMEDVVVEAAPGTDPANWMKRHLACADAVVLVGGSGIAAHLADRVLADAEAHAAVVLLNEEGAAAIPLDAGDMGRRGQLARAIARELASSPHVAGTERGGVFSIDAWACGHGFAIANPTMIPRVTGALLEGREVRLVNDFPVVGPPPRGMHVGHAGDETVFLTCQASLEPGCLQVWVPCLTVGIDCPRGATVDEIARAAGEALAAGGFAVEAVERVAGLAVMQHEPGLCGFASRNGWELSCYSGEELAEVPADKVSASFPGRMDDIDTLVERAAVLGSQRGELVVPKLVAGRVAVAVARRHRAITFVNADGRRA